MLEQLSPGVSPLMVSVRSLKIEQFKEKTTTHSHNRLNTYFLEHMFVITGTEKPYFMKQLLLASLLCTSSLIFAQQRTGNLTIFSEDGDKFYLVLNGEKQNEQPQSNLRVEELPQPYYNARIVFADPNIAPVSKNNLMIADVDNKMMDVTYKIRKDKTGKAKLNYFSSIEVEPNYIPPSGVCVYRYGMPSQVRISNGTVLTTTTTTTTGESVSANVNMNGMGIGMNVTINDPLMQTTTTTTTTTTTSSGSNHSDNRPSPPKERGCNGWPMNSSDFNAALKTIGNSSFDETKVSTAKAILSKNCVSAEQVIKLCNLFSFEDSKLTLAKYAYRYTTDKKNYFKVNDVFSFSSSKEELNRFVSGEDSDQ